MVRKKCARNQMLVYTANTQLKVISREACSGSHFLALAWRQQGHDVRLMPAQSVKPYVKTNKRDYMDAEAVRRPTMHFVPIKTEEQWDLQAVYRIREPRSDCIAVCNGCQQLNLESRGSTSFYLNWDGADHRSITC